MEKTGESAGAESKVAQVKESVAEKKDAVVEQVKEKVSEKADVVVGQTKEAVTSKLAGAVEAVAQKVSDKLPGDTEEKKDSVVAAVVSKVEEAVEAVAQKVSEKLPGGGATTPGTRSVERPAGETGAGEQASAPIHKEEGADPEAEDLRSRAEDLRESGQPILAKATELDSERVD